jgi:hypothetical protein
VHIAFVDFRHPFAELWSRDGAEWKHTTVEGMAATLDFTAIGLSLPLTAVYKKVRLKS